MWVPERPEESIKALEIELQTTVTQLWVLTTGPQVQQVLLAAELPPAPGKDIYKAPNTVICHVESVRCFISPSNLFKSCECF